MNDVPTTPDPIEMAMEAEAAGAPPSGVAARVLARQERLIGWQIASERAGFALKVLTAAAGIAAAAVLGAMAWNASRDASLVIDPIEAPADLVREGSTGSALAHALQDKLKALQAEAQAPYVGSEVRDRAGADLKVQIPATGISLSDLDLALRQALGRQTHVTAEVARVSSGPQTGALALSLRVGGEPGVRLVQADGDLDALMARGAEQAYRAAQPINYGYWLSYKGRIAEARAVARPLAARGTPLERAKAYYLLSGLEGLDGSTRGRRDLLLQAVTLSDGRLGMNEYAGTQNGLGQSESAYKAWVEMARRKIGSADMTAEFREAAPLFPKANAGLQTGDFKASLQLDCYRLKLSTCDRNTILAAFRADPTLVDRNGSGSSAAQAFARQHDVGAVQALVALRVPPDPTRSPAQMAVRNAQWRLAVAITHREVADWAAVLRDVEAFDATKLAAQDGAYTVGANRGLALANLGDRAGAQAAAAQLATDCYLCLIMRGRIAASLGDPAGADRWLAEGVRQGPSLPIAEAVWAEMLVKQGRWDEAIVQAKRGVKKGPKFADPLAWWGEALLAKGDAKGAEAKFAAAAKITPYWGRLNLRWGQALAKLGRADEARAKWKAAATMGLTPAERAERAELAGVMR